MVCDYVHLISVRNVRPLKYTIGLLVYLQVNRCTALRAMGDFLSKGGFGLNQILKLF